MRNEAFRMPDMTSQLSLSISWAESVYTQPWEQDGGKKKLIFFFPLFFFFSFSFSPSSTVVGMFHTDSHGNACLVSGNILPSNWWVPPASANSTMLTVYNHQQVSTKSKSLSLFLILCVCLCLFWLLSLAITFSCLLYRFPWRYGSHVTFPVLHWRASLRAATGSVNNRQGHENSTDSHFNRRFPISFRNVFRSVLDTEPEPVVDRCLFLFQSVGCCDTISSAIRKSASWKDTDR